MLITKIELKNVKSYASQTVHFAEGTNAISGENGAGKSTLLESIGFALFDFLPFNRADFVREGQKTAVVTVHFISSQDDREYQVERRCGSQSDYFVYDPELNAKLVIGKTDVQDWLREQLGTEANFDLSVLFRDAIGVPQGLLTAPFLESSGPRKQLFDKLMQVDEYRQSWTNLRESTRVLEEQIHDKETTLAAMGASVSRLPSLRQHLEDRQIEIAAIQSRLEILSKDIQTAEDQRKELETVKEDLDGTALLLSKLETRLQGLDKQLTTATEAANHAQAAQEKIEDCQPGYLAYQAARDKQAELETERQQRDELRVKKNHQEKSLALSRARLEKLETDLTRLDEAETQIAILRPKVACQQDLEGRLIPLRQQLAEYQVALSMVQEHQAKLQSLGKRQEIVQQELQLAGQIRIEMKQAGQRLEEIQHQALNLNAEQAAVVSEIDRLTQQVAILETADSPDCPVCEQPLTPERRVHLFDSNLEQIAALRVRADSLKEDIESNSEVKATLDQQIEDCQQQMNKLSRPDDQAELASEIGQTQDNLSVAEKRADELAQSQAQLDSIQEELEDLHNPRSRFDALTAQTSERTSIQDELDSENQAAQKFEVALAEIEGCLIPFENLEGLLYGQKAILAQHQQAHQSYLENTRLATELPARLEAVHTLKVERQDLENDLVQNRTKHEKLVAGFDTQDLVAARQNETALKTEQATLMGRLSTHQQQKSDLDDEIETLEAAEQVLDTEKRALQRIVEILKLLQFFRETIREAGPHVVRRVVQQVSLQASQLFSTIMADHSARLLWREDYGIDLEKDGRSREFKQLSGGEQMVAALAVRLALLRELSAIDVAFFDEPTSNLDDVRRDNLANQIASVRDTGFSQIFIISHDDAFEQSTDHVVRVWKKDGLSQIEVESELSP